MKAFSWRGWLVYSLPIYLGIIAVGTTAFWLSYIFSQNSGVAILAAVPGAGALIGALFQIFRDHAAFERSRILLNANNDFILSVTSHMANVAFNKHVEFTETYLREAEKGLSKLFGGGPSKEASDFARELYKIRTDFSSWVTEEIRNELEPFEQALHKIGAQSGLLEHIPVGEQRTKLVQDLYDTYKRVAGIKEPGEKDVKAKEEAARLKESFQEFLGVRKLTALRKHYVDEAFHRCEHKSSLFQMFCLLLVASISISGRAATNVVETDAGLPDFGDTTNSSQAIITVIRNAAEHGDADAQNNLGWIYLNGYGVSKNADEAIKWLTKSAENGNLQAAGRLAAHYFFDAGEDKNIQEGIRWYRFGAERGDILDQTTLALILRQGGFPLGNIKIEKDPNEAAKWYLRAARQGDGDAQIEIGEMYAQGEGVRQDFVEAYKWFNIAAASPEKPDLSVFTATNQETLKQLLPRVAQKAKEHREDLVQRMTPDQISEAQQLSREFRPRKERSASSASPENPTATGTGFFITDDGYLISNYHVVNDATKVRLRTSAGLIDAKVVQVDAANDLALLKADGRFAPLPIAVSRTVNLGSTVATIGFPNIGMQGFAPKLAKGEIASLSGAADDPRYFQISVPVQPGNSGGALVDERGNVIGIVSAKLDASVALAASGALPENVNYAVKSSFLLSFLESVPAVSAKLKTPNTKDEKFEDVVKSAQAAAVLVLVY